MRSVLIILLLITSLQAQRARLIGVREEPSHKYAGGSLGVYDAFTVELAPHSATLLHVHHQDYISVTLADSHVLDEIAGKPSVELNLKKGQTRFRPGQFSHVLKNLSDQTYREVIVQLPQYGQYAGARSKSGEEEKFHGGSVKTLFIRDGVRVEEINLQPGATVPDHHYHGLHLVVAITDCDLRGDIAGWKPMPLKFKAGDVQPLPGGYTNTGHQPARFVTLGF
jgi:hypothetical protein